MVVKAEIPKHGVTIRGELDANVRADGDEFIGTIPVLHLVTQGHTEQQAYARLERLFAEYCEVAVEQERLIEILRARGFRVGPVEPGRSRSAQYLLITSEPEIRRDYDSREMEADLAGAGSQ